REAFREPPESMPVFGTIAARFNDDGVTALYQALADALGAKGLGLAERRLPRPAAKVSSNVHVIIPAKRQRYLAEIAESVRGYHDAVRQQSQLARELQQLRSTQAMLSTDVPELGALVAEKETALEPGAKKL